MVAKQKGPSQNFLSSLKKVFLTSLACILSSIIVSEQEESLELLYQKIVNLEAVSYTHLTLPTNREL